MATVVRGPWEGLTIAGGRYQQLTTLGEGGMGYVYRALDRNLKIPVVIKTPRRALIDQPGQISRFEQEIGAMVQLSFPHIVPVIDVGRHDELPFAVMRYLPGGSLEARMPRDAGGQWLPMPPQGLAGWLPSIAKALDFVHRRGYLHRDVKPPNILFDQHEEAYLSDFGVIKVLGEATEARSRRLTGEGLIVGTVDYMAPELLTGQAFDGRADQYALAVTVYEVLSGQLPFDGNTPAAVMMQHLNQAPRPLAAHAIQLPAAVSDAVAKAMAKDPQQRFADCSAFADAVLQAVAAAPAAPPAAATARRRATAIQPLPRPPGDTDRKTLATAAGAPAPAKPRKPTPVQGTPRPTAVQNSAGRAPAAPTSVQQAPTRHAPQPPASRLPQRSRKAWLAGAAGGGVAMVSGIVLWAIFASTSDTGGTATGPAWSSSPLPKRMAAWKDRADGVERVLLVDSQPVLANPQYASSAELTALLAGRTTKTAPTTGADLKALETDLTAMAELQQRSANELQHYRQQPAAAAAIPEAREQAASQQRELDDQASQLLVLARRLQALKQAFASPQGSYDAGATAELAALREMESAVAAEHHVPIGSAALDRAGQLATARNPGLAWLAVNALARSGDPQRAKTAIKWLGTYPPDRQAQLCWSLLLSGESGAMSAAVAHLHAHPEQLAKLDRKPLIELVAEKPVEYQALLPLLVTSCETPDERFELFRIQAPLMNDAWAHEIEQSCATGLLRDRVEEVVLAIVGQHIKQAFPLAERLLEKHRGLALAKLPPAELDGLLQDQPALAGKIAEQWILRGSEPQRAAALTVYGDPRSKINPDQLQQRIESDPPTDPTALLNQALASPQAKAVELAEFLLTHARPLQAARLNYAGASPGALARAPVRKELFKLAWQVPERGQAWTLEQLLGRRFVEQFQAADTTRASQLKIVAPLVKTLEGRVVTLKNVGSSAARDRGLQVAARELPRLPSDVDPTRWAPAAEAHTRLAALRTELEPVRSSADALFAGALDQIDRYLSDLVTLNSVTYEVSRIYDVTIAKQLPGARREMQLKRLDSWDFRFPGASIENFQRQCTLYRDLLKSLETTRKSLAIVAEQPAP